MCSSEQIAEGVVEQVDEGGSIQVSIAHHLGGKQSLPGSAPKETSHHAITHVHVMSHFLNASLQGADIRPLVAAAVHVLVKLCQKTVQ